MERLLDLFDKADPFSTWWPTIAAVVVGLVITVRWVKGVLWQAVALWHTKRGSGRLSEELRQSVAAPHHTFSWGNLRKSAMIRKVQKAAGAEVASLHRQTLPDTLRHIHLYRYIYPYISHIHIYIYIFVSRQVKTRFIWNFLSGFHKAGDEEMRIPCPHLLPPSHRLKLAPNCGNVFG